MITIHFIDFEPEPVPDAMDGLEAQVAAMNSWLASRPDINVVTIETISYPPFPGVPTEPGDLSSEISSSNIFQIIRVWYEGDP